MVTKRKIHSKTSGGAKLSLLKKSRTHYHESPDKAWLEAFENTYSDRDYWVDFDCPEFTSLCPVTGQAVAKNRPERWQTAYAAWGTLMHAGQPASQRNGPERD